MQDAGALCTSRGAGRDLQLRITEEEVRVPSLVKTSGNGRPESVVREIWNISAAKGAPVLVFVSAGYVQVFQNWVSYACACSNQPIVAVCLDRYVEERLQGEPGVHTVRMYTDGTLASLWVARARLFAGLCGSAVSFVHSDADAIWLRDPVAWIEELGVDVAFSQGTVWPHDVVREWGFVLCCGFFYVRASRRTCGLFEEIARASEAEGDDQIAVNRTLMDGGVVWDVSANGEETHVLQGFEYSTFREPVVGRGKGLKLALLPHRRFQRHPVDLVDNVAVVHPLTPKAGESKRERLSELGLWSLP